MTPKLRWQVVLVVVGIVAAGAVLFAFRQPPESTAVVPEVGGLYVEAVVGNPVSMNPILAQFNDVDKDLVALLFSGLTKPDDKGRMMPDLATDWTVGGEGKSYVFHLRSGVKWHDGDPFTAEDVVFTVKALQDPDYQGNPDFAALWKNVAVEKVNDLTVRFDLKEPYAPFLTYTALGVLPAHVLKGVPAKDLPNHAFRANPVGTGRFRLSEATAQYVILQRNENYYGDKPYISRLKLVFFADDQSALAALRKKEVQGVSFVPYSAVSSLAGDPNITLYRSHRTMSTLLYLNQASPFFKSHAVREALACAVDRDQIIAMVLLGEGTGAYGPVLPEVWAFDPGATPPKYDAARAAALLEEEGWKVGADGIREKDGQKFVFSLMTNDDRLRIGAAEMLARQFRRVGLKAEIAASGYSGLLQNFLIPRRFDAILFGWDNGFDPDGYGSWHSTQNTADGFNFASYANKRMDEVLEQARQTADEAERLGLYGEFQKIFAEDVPSIFIYYPGYTYAVDKSVKGVRLGLIDEPSARFDHLSDWYLKYKTVRVAKTAGE